ncbi:hypothetical protein GDO78_005964 [Eleutherodactylus coqui]|uniref:High mobility group AT-hook 2 n=1 Tax=Eleutherodactylus coqui TaxID=57060 RepID=A0A8J6KDW9_ELECQ|nr:hypothetical protein GDO78_005964 [Eleutherodactylus coqui]
MCPDLCMQQQLTSRYLRCPVTCIVPVPSHTSPRPPSGVYAVRTLRETHRCTLLLLSLWWQQQQDVRSGTAAAPRVDPSRCSSSSLGLNMSSKESGRQSAEHPASTSESPKRARGRPRKPQKEPAAGEPSPKRPRGRPKGSKNKGPSKSAQKKEESSGEKRPRGRPRKWPQQEKKSGQGETEEASSHESEED